MILCSHPRRDDELDYFKGGVVLLRSHLSLRTQNNIVVHFNTQVQGPPTITHGH
jgi:hypothetical protein